MAPNMEPQLFMEAVLETGGVTAEDEDEEEGGFQGAGDMWERVMESGIVVPRATKSTPTTWSRMSQTAWGPPAPPPISKQSQNLVQAPTPPAAPLGPAAKRSSGGLASTPVPPKGPRWLGGVQAGLLDLPWAPVSPIAPTPPLFYHRAGGVQVSADLAPKAKLLSQIADKTRARYLQRAKLYTPWTPTDVDLWAAHHLLNRTGEWAVKGPSFLPSGSARRGDSKGAKHGCDFCP